MITNTLNNIIIVFTEVALNWNSNLEETDTGSNSASNHKEKLNCVLITNDNECLAYVVDSYSVFNKVR